MWNYNFVLPTILEMTIFVIYFHAKPRPPLHVNQTFLRLTTVDILTIVTDYLASVADSEHESSTIFLLYTLNMLFFVFYLMRSYLFFQIALDILRLEYRKYRSILLWTSGVLVGSELITLSSVFTGAVFTIDAGGYHRGPLYDVIYVCFFFYIFAAMILACVHRRRLNSYELLSILGYNLILLTGNIFRILMPRYLIMNVFCMLAITVIYLSFENPDLYLDERGRAFNMRAFRDVLVEKTRDRNNCVLGVALKDYNAHRGIYGGRQMDKGIAMICHELKKRYKNETVFYLRSGVFAILGRADMDTGRMCREIRERFQKPWEAENANLFLSVSFVRIDLEPDPDSVNRAIDTLMIALTDERQASSAEEQGTDVVREVNRQLEIQRALEKALEKDEVEVFLQPIQECRGGEIIAAEALARIRDGEGEIISPEQFVPIAEHSGHVILLGEQVLEKVCAFIRSGGMEKTGLRWVNVNMSPLQCMRSDLGERFSAILARYGVTADRIHLEITEQAMIDFEMLRHQIQTLQELGFQFSLDDYGSGYSNLSRVRRIPFSNIKVDMQVVRDYFHKPDRMLPMLVKMFKELGFSVTAEGIETEEMMRGMAAMGCDYLQGYLFSRPLPMPEFMEKYRIS